MAVNPVAVRELAEKIALIPFSPATSPFSFQREAERIISEAVKPLIDAAIEVTEAGRGLEGCGVFPVADVSSLRAELARWRIA